MPGLFSFYLKERENLEVLECDAGFAIYQIVDDMIYLKDIYVVPSERQTGLAKWMADQIAEIGRDAGCKKMIGSVSPIANNATLGMKAILSYGFSLLKSTESLILFSKEI